MYTQEKLGCLLQIYYILDTLLYHTYTYQL